MTKKNIKSGEQKIINLINEVVDTPNLNFSDIKSKIVIETNQEKETKPKRYYKFVMSKYALASMFVFLFIVASLLTININKELSTNFELTNYLTETNLYVDGTVNKNSSFDNTGIYSVLYKQKNIVNTRIVKVNMSDVNKGGIYSAYLSKKIISKIQDYPRGGDYEDFRNRTKLYGFDDILVKYYYYCEKEHIELSQINKELKWMSYNVGEDIDERIYNYQIVFNSYVYEINDVYDIESEKEMNLTIRCITEIDKVTSNLNDIKYYTTGGEYLLNIEKSSTNYLYITNEIFIETTALIENIGGRKIIKGVMPKWYYSHLNNELINDKYSNDILQLDSWLTALNDYLLYEEKIFDEKLQFETSINYYDYNVIEYLKCY